jgi:predicted Zn-ribbon and HTH transcriptional regulator
MRVRPLRQTDRRPPLAERRPHGLGRADEAEGEVAADRTVDDTLSAERRHRASVAPEDTAHYGCSCGFQFQASVTTSVTCPHCGSAQAW